MSWNHPTGPVKPVKKNAPPSMLKGIAAGLVLVAVLAAALYVVHGRARTPAAPQPKESPKKSAAIKEVTPAAASTNRVARIAKAQPQPAPKEIPIWEQPIPDDIVDEDSRAAWKRMQAYQKKLATDERLKKYLRTHKPKKTIYKTGTEQVLDWIFTSAVGDAPPPPLPAVASFELNHMDEMLDSVNEISEDDSEETKNRKKIVDEVKKELKKYLKEGGTLGEFLTYYRNQLVEAHERKNMTADAISDVIKEGDADLSVKFIEKANQQLEDQGITPVELTEDQKEDLAEGLMQNEQKK